MTEVPRMYISLPITGQEDTILERCDMIIDYCEKHFPEYDIVFPPDIKDAYDGNDWEEPHNYAWYIGNDLMVISECDAILMTKGWKDSLGCRVEHDVALKTGITVLYMSEKRED